MGIGVIITGLLTDSIIKLPIAIISENPSDIATNYAIYKQKVDAYFDGYEIDDINYNFIITLDTMIYREAFVIDLDNRINSILDKIAIKTTEIQESEVLIPVIKNNDFVFDSEGKIVTEKKTIKTEVKTAKFLPYDQILSMYEIDYKAFDYILQSLDDGYVEFIANAEFADNISYDSSIDYSLYDVGSLSELSDAITKDRLALYGGTIDVTYNSNNLPIYEDVNGAAGGLVGMGYLYSLESLDPDQLDFLPTQYTNGRQILIDKRIIPAIEAMFSALEKTSLDPIYIVDGYRSQSTQGILFVTANCNQQAVELNKNDEVQKWIASKTSKTVAQLKRGDISGIDWLDLRKELYSSSAPIFMSRYVTYVTLPSGVNPHSTGRAIDIANMNQEHKNWLIRNADEFGFYNYSREIWHWEYNLIGE